MNSLNVELIANIIGLIGSLLMVLMGCLKKKKDVLLAQNGQLVLLSVSNVMMGGYIGAIVNVIAIFRNILCSKNKLNLFWGIIITMVTIVLGVIFNSGQGFIGYMPIIATLIFLVFMNLKDMVKFKAMMAFVMFLWLIYDLELGLYTTALFDLITVFSCLIVMYNLAHERPNQQKKPKRRGRRKSKSK